MTLDGATGGPRGEFAQKSALDELPAEQLAPDESLVQDESLAAVRTAINRLPHDLKVTLLLHHYDQLSYREIGLITGCSERGVETRLYRARQQLRELLAGHLHQPVRS
jgi:RNA polymerase sigma-70 factor (ECF subfamily)